MSVLDRVRRTDKSTGIIENGGQTSEDLSSTLEAKSEVAARIKLVAEELVHYVDSKGAESPFSGHMWFIKSIFGIFYDEMKGKDDEILAMWVGQFGCLLEWCGTGDDSKLPPDVVAYLHLRHPEREQLAIESGV